MQVLIGLIRVALIDLRGDFRRFWVLIACLALGVGTIAMVGAVGASLQSALNRDARQMLGGDIEARLTYRAATADETALFDRLGTVSEAVDLLGRAQFEGESVFAAVRAVDAKYPLLGAVEYDGDGPLADLLAAKDGSRGVVVDALLLDKLGVAIGDRIGIGAVDFQIRGVLESVPDQVSQGIAIGFPVLMSLDGVGETDILKPGALARYRYKIILNAGTGFDAASAAITAGFPEAGWQISGPDHATEELGRYFDLFQRFLTVVGLSALLVGGIGVANAMSAYVTERQRSIATMKSLGATRARVLAHFMIQALVLTGIGIVLGTALGAVLTLGVLPFLGPAVGLPLSPTIDWPSLGSAAIFGLLIGFAFAYLPLHRAEAMRPAILFRAVGSTPEAGLTWRDVFRPGLILPMAFAIAGIFGMAVLVTGRPPLVVWYAIGAAAAFGVLGAASALLQGGLRLIPPAPNASIRNAIKAIYRPGAPAPTIIMSLGLGMALLILIATVVNDLRHQLDPEVRVDAPTFVYLDLFDDEVAELQAFAKTEPRIERFTTVPVLRSPTLSVNGSPPVTIEEIPRDISLYFGDEQPLSVSTELPGGNTIVGGSWWPADYSGEPLVSVAAQMQKELDLRLGDKLTFLVFGEEVTATVASFREFDWQRGRINFPFVLSPGAFDEFPLSYFAFIKAAAGSEHEVQRELTERYPALIFIPVDEALGVVRELIDGISNAIAIVGAIAVVSGLLVLAGALASGRHQREADSVVAKVLGATRADVLRSYVIEYGLVSAIAAALATALGVTGAWAFATLALGTHFSIDPLLLAMVIAGAMVLTIAVGAATTWSALSAQPAKSLRDE